MPSEVMNDAPHDSHAPVRAKSQPQRVFDGVSGRIHAGALKPGDRVPSEPELMREFGVSRTVVREAMSRLQASGLVDTRQGVGTFVLAPPTAEPLLAVGSRNIKLRQVLAMLELRISLEAEAASLAALRRSDEHLAKMRAALDAFDTHRRAGGSTIEDDFRFHAQIAVATGNEYFEEVLASLGSATIARRPTGTAAPAAQSGAEEPGHRFGEPLPLLEPGKEITQAEHDAIYEAIRRGDPAAARAAMFMHLSNSRERLRAKVGGE
jgi:DNA-binding FadR family transcriptional regulator